MTTPKIVLILLVCLKDLKSTKFNIYAQLLLKKKGRVNEWVSVRGKGSTCN